MSAPNWTPGEYSAFADPESDGSAVVRAVYHDSQGRRCTQYIAVCSSIGSDNLANAQRFAATPEMYAALEGMERLFAINGEGLMRGKVASEIRAALAKARGEV